jgi:hypothetical protein
MQVLVAALVPGLILAGAVPAAAADADPTGLSRGPDTTLPVLNRRTEVLTVGGTEWPIDVPGKAQRVQRVDDGTFLVTSLKKNRSTLTVFGLGGERRVLSRNMSTFALSPDRSAVAFSVGWSGDTPVAVVQLDGTVVSNRVFPAYTGVGLFDTGRVLLNRGADTVSWRPIADRVRLLVEDANVVGGSVLTDRLSLVGTQDYPPCSRVVTLDDVENVLWQSCSKVAYSWSPDGDHAVAVHPATDGYGASTLLLVRTDTGVVERRLTGDALLQSWWEDDAQLVVVAHDLDSDVSALVRCGFTGPCERTTRRYDATPSKYLAGISVTPATL